MNHSLMMRKLIRGEGLQWWQLWSGAVSAGRAGAAFGERDSGVSRHIARSGAQLHEQHCRRIDDDQGFVRR
jgi:hypothetical protein